MSKYNQMLTIVQDIESVVKGMVADGYESPSAEQEVLEFIFAHSNPKSLKAAIKEMEETLELK